MVLVADNSYRSPSSDVIRSRATHRLVNVIPPTPLSNHLVRGHSYLDEWNDGMMMSGGERAVGVLPWGQP